ncbi:unnamed protein product [Rhodiola kirilowii]
MAGTLPGVEAARRRRFHHGASDHAASWIRKSSFRHEFCPTSSCASASSSSPSLRSSCYAHEHHLSDEMLGEVAREAKERLDEKLRNQRKLIPVEPIRHGKKAAQHVAKFEDVVKNMEVKRSGSKRLMGLGMGLGWTRLGWKASEQEECSICLDGFIPGEALAHLPCAHRFHSKCLDPWVQSNAHCPCCRMSLTSPNAKTKCEL